MRIKFFLLISAFVFLLVCTQCSQKEPEVPTVIDKTNNKLPAGKGSIISNFYYKAIVFNCDGIYFCITNFSFL